MTAPETVPASTATRSANADAPVPLPAPARALGRRRHDTGSASLEFLGVLPILLLVALAGIQLGLVAYTASQAGTAARTAARTASLRPPHPDPAQAGRSAVSTWLRDGTRIDTATDGDSVTVTATIDIPSVIPGVRIFDPVHRTATMPKEDTAR